MSVETHTEAIPVAQLAPAPALDQSATPEAASGQDVQSLRAIMEMLPTGVVIADAEAKVLFHNRAAQRILGAADAARGGPSEWTPVFGWYLPDQATLLSPEELPLRRVLRGEDVCEELVLVRNAHRPAGVWIRVSGKLLRDASGATTAAAMVFSDVTEGLLREQTSSLLSQVVEQIADGVFLTDRQGFIEYVNPAFEAMTGFSPEDVRGKTPRILKSGALDSGFYQQLWSELAAGHPFQGTLVNRRKTGELYHVEETIVPILDQTGLPTHFVATMRDITESLARQEREVQLRLARQIQQKFYCSPPLVPGFEIAAEAYPAYHTSGDYFDFIPLSNGRLAIAVGDVEGHGFGSALVMALTRAYMRSFAAMDLEVDQILMQVNRMLAMDLGSGCFVTLVLASLDVANRTLVYASAGHVPGYVIGESGQVEQTLESSGPPLGLFPEISVSRSPSITLLPGQLVVLLTDGITESTSPDGDEWGAEGALAYVRSCRDLATQELVDGLYREARGFACNGLQQDDITSVIVRVDG